MKLGDLGREIANIQGGGTVAIITDSNVAPLYLAICEESIRTAGLKAVSFIIPAGEESKNASQYIELLEKLAKVPLTRTDGIVALGGGVVGDLGGFVAATYLRGIKLYQVPTTLLAMVDSSIGGKVGIDLAAGKNLAGAFYLPNLIFRDSSVLNTLPDDVFREGCAEVIKYGIILDRSLYDKLTECPINKTVEVGKAVKVNADGDSHCETDIDEVIDRCAQIKTEIVAQDPRDNGVRQLLNFGHTIGHAIEKLSNYRVSHGDAVAKGMYAITRIAVENNWCEQKVLDEVESILKNYGFDLSIPYAAADIVRVIAKDKKRKGDYIDIIIPKEIGRCVIERMSMQEFETAIDKYLSKAERVLV